MRLPIQWVGWGRKRARDDLVALNPAQTQANALESDRLVRMCCLMMGVELEDE